MDLELSVSFNANAFLACLGQIPAMCDFRRPWMGGAGQRAMKSIMKWEQTRFLQNSGGGGSWAPLSPVTIKKRLEKQAKDAGVKNAAAKIRRAVNAVQLPILFVTGTLEAGLFEEGANGHFQTVNKSTIREGARGGRHPDAPISVGELAAVQHFGDPSRNLPARPVMVMPDSDTVAFVGQILANGLQDAFNALSAGVGSSQAAQIA